MPPEDDPPSANAYDELADEYADAVETNPYNADLEFPGTTGLVPDVTGKRVLDAGCGSGVYTEWLLEQGADVVAVDASEEMLAHARDRVGSSAEFHRAELGTALDFADDGEFDGVVSALVLDHVRDWQMTFAEFARILQPGGFVVFSVVHPVEGYVDYEDVNYFETERIDKEWWSVDIPYYRRPLAEMLTPVLETGFRVDGIAEPQPTESFEEKEPEAFEKESRQPVFLCLRVVKG